MGRVSKYVSLLLQWYFFSLLYFLFPYTILWCNKSRREKNSEFQYIIYNSYRGSKCILFLCLWQRIVWEGWLKLLILLFLLSVWVGGLLRSFFLCPQFCVNRRETSSIFLDLLVWLNTLAWMVSLCSVVQPFNSKLFFHSSQQCSLETSNWFVLFSCQCTISVAVREQVPFCFG